MNKLDAVCRRRSRSRPRLLDFGLECIYTMYSRPLLVGTGRQPSRLAAPARWLPPAPPAAGRRAGPAGYAGTAPLSSSAGSHEAVVRAVSSR
jgi:hypothetical protein